MFGPTTRSKIIENIDYNHREPRFFELYKETIYLLKEKFSLYDYDILFLSGSGTLAVESLIYSSKYIIQPAGPQGVFWRRWSLLSEYYNQTKDKDK